MTEFIDGPAAGVTLLLHRAPHYLRAVHGAKGWDGLDQLTDQPAADEEIVVYRLVGEPTWMHIRRARRDGGSGIFRGGKYQVVYPQPAQDAVRETGSWRAWVSEQLGLALNADGTEAGAHA